MKEFSKSVLGIQKKLGAERQFQIDDLEDTEENTSERLNRHQSGRKILIKFGISNL